MVFSFFLIYNVAVMSKPLYFAPLEGIGNHIYRSAFTRHYSGVDRFYTPFIDINSDGGMKNRNVNDILPENNAGITLIPQILTRNADALGEASRRIAGLGYREINLNLGCPSPTVTKKGKGSGMLADPLQLQAFLEQAFRVSATALSVKMRIGICSTEEWEPLLEVLNDFPIAELIVHPRLTSQVYSGGIHEDIFRAIYETSRNPVCLNPGIREAAEFYTYAGRYPKITGLMIGRGLVSDPALAEKIVRGNNDTGSSREQTAASEVCAAANRASAQPDLPDERKRFRDFHDDLLESYRQVLSGETPVLFKMKELWDYWDKAIDVDPKLRKKITKAGSISEYVTCVQQIL